MRECLAAIAILTALPAAADPASRERAAVIAVDLGPGTPPYLRESATGQIEAGLAAAGYQMVPAAEVRARLTGELSWCREGACVRKVGQVLGVRSLVFVTISGKDENTILAMRLHDGSTGEKDAEVREVCDLCGQAELSERLGIAASALRARALEVRARKAKPAAGPATPGTGTGPVPGTGAGAAPRAGDGDRPSIVPGIVAGAAGVAALAGGLYLMRIDGRGTCDRGDQPVYPAPGAVIRYPDPANMDRFICRDVYKTQTPGIATAGAGVVALAAGVALFVRARQRDRAVELVPRSGGATVEVTWAW